MNKYQYILNNFESVMADALYRGGKVDIQVKILKLFFIGHSLTEISIELNRSYKTIQTYILRACNKLGIKGDKKAIKLIHRVYEIFDTKIKQEQEGGDE